MLMYSMMALSSFLQTQAVSAQPKAGSVGVGCGGSGGGGGCGGGGGDSDDDDDDTADKVPPYMQLKAGGVGGGGDSDV